MTMLTMSRRARLGTRACALVGSTALSALFLLALPAGATAQNPPSPREKLAIWAGHWKIRIETKETQFGHARTDSYDAKCSVLPHGTFVFCDYLSLQPDADSGRVIKEAGATSLRPGRVRPPAAGQ